jgi:hypothetical protein
MRSGTSKGLFTFSGNGLHLPRGHCLLSDRAHSSGLNRRLATGDGCHR